MRSSRAVDDAANATATSPSSRLTAVMVCSGKEWSSPRWLW